MFNNGLTLCFIVGTIQASTSTCTITYPISFNNYPKIGMACGGTRSFYGVCMGKTSLVVSSGLWQNSGVLQSSGISATTVFCAIIDI